MFRGVGFFNYGNQGIGPTLIEKNTITLKTNFLLNIRNKNNFTRENKINCNFVLDINLPIEVKNYKTKTNFINQIRKNINFELTETKV
jgi:hypothetical protein